MTTTQTPSPTPSPSSGAPTKFELALGWGAVVLPIGAWAAHLVALAALTNQACGHRSVVWVMHGLTIGLALFCLVCALIGVHFARRPATAVGNGAFRFLGVLAAILSVVNLLLIVWEGAYVPFLQKCH